MTIPLQPESLAEELMRDVASRAGVGDPFSCDIFATDDWRRDWADRIGRFVTAKDAEIATLRGQVEALKTGLGAVRRRESKLERFTPDDEIVGYGHIHVERMADGHIWASLAGNSFDFVVQHKSAKVTMNPQDTVRTSARATTKDTP